MTDSELQALVEQVSLADFGRSFVHKAMFNRRLRTTGGRYVLQTHNLEINPLMIEEFNEQTLVGVIKHELVHYHNHLQGLPYQHKDRYFQTELQRIAGLRYAPATSKAKVRKQPKHYWIYTCKNGHEIYRQRRLNELRYACGKCGAPIRLTGELKIGD